MCSNKECEKINLRPLPETELVVKHWPYTRLTAKIPYLKSHVFVIYCLHIKPNSWRSSVLKLLMIACNIIKLFQCLKHNCKDGWRHIHDDLVCSAKRPRIHMISWESGAWVIRSIKFHSKYQSVILAYVLAH